MALPNPQARVRTSPRCVKSASWLAGAHIRAKVVLVGQAVMRDGCVCKTCAVLRRVGARVYIPQSSRMPDGVGVMQDLRGAEVEQEQTLIVLSMRTGAVRRLSCRCAWWRANRIHIT
jgi:hypothetical protein